MENRSLPFEDNVSLSDLSSLDQLDQLDSKFFEENFLDPITSFVPVNINLYQNSNKKIEIEIVYPNRINHFKMSFPGPHVSLLSKGTVLNH